MSDVPLEPLEGRFTGVVELDSFRIRHGRTPYELKKDLCQHSRLIMCQSERRIWCEDCQTNVDPFEAVLKFQREWSRLQDKVNAEAKKARDGLAATLVRRAAKALDKIWSGKMLPCCPHCHNALYPEHFENGGAACVSREYDEAKRRLKAADISPHGPASP